jgi:UDP-glucose 4-epimerase
MSRILVTGATSWEGARLIHRLLHRGGVTVIAVDDEDRRALPVPLHRSALDTLDFAHFVIASNPTTIIHLATADRSGRIGRDRSRESVILGTQALFGATERLRDLGHVVVRSEGNVYGIGNRRALIAREEERPGGQAARHARALREVETYAREASKAAGVPLAILRPAESVGPHVDTPFAHLLRLPIVPILWGFDPLLQLINEDDLRDAFLHVVDNRLDGAFNVAPSRPLYLSQILRLAHIRAQRLPKPQLESAHRFLARGGLAVPTQTRALLRHGRVLAGDGLATAGFQPKHTTRDVASAMAEIR